MKEMQMELDQHIDQLNQSKEQEMESLKTTYAELFNEKAHELQSLRTDHDTSQRKIEQQNRTISDLEYKEKELNSLLSKKQGCHHREFEKTFHEMEKEMINLKQASQASETELNSLRDNFKRFQAQVIQTVKGHGDTTTKLNEDL